MDILRNILISYLTNLMAYYNKITPLRGDGKAKDITSLDFSKVFSTVLQKILTEDGVWAKCTGSEMNLKLVE